MERASGGVLRVAVESTFRIARPQKTFPASFWHVSGLLQRHSVVLPPSRPLSLVCREPWTSLSWPRPPLSGGRKLAPQSHLHHPRPPTSPKGQSCSRCFVGGASSPSEPFPPSMRLARSARPTTLVPTFSTNAPALFLAPGPRLKHICNYRKHWHFPRFSTILPPMKNALLPPSLPGVWRPAASWGKEGAREAQRGSKTHFDFDAPPPFGQSRVP
jgi:hypothetical protein